MPLHTLVISTAFELDCTHRGMHRLGSFTVVQHLLLFSFSFDGILKKPNLLDIKVVLEGKHRLVSLLPLFSFCISHFGPFLVAFNSKQMLHSGILC